MTTTERLAQIERDLAEVVAVARILAWSKTGKWQAAPNPRPKVET